MMLKYKEYVGNVEFDDEANIFHGEVINIKDVITFQGESVAELRQAFIDSVEDYLEFCKERGEEPEKPFSGKFVVRVKPELHQKLSLVAKKTGKSLNAFIVDSLEQVTAKYL
jgi:predicted HicB family RNase H-like nuclease